MSVKTSNRMSCRSLVADEAKIHTLTTTGTPTTEAGIGTIGTTSSTFSKTEYGNAILHKTVFTCTDTPITLTDTAGAGQWGGLKLYDFPEGMLCTLGATVDGVLENDGTATIIDTFTGVIAIGTATASATDAAATLTGTEADILQSAALTQAVAGIANCDSQSIATALTESGARWHDGTATAKDAYLNVAIADDVTHTAGTILFTGTVTVAWLLLGDN